MSACTCGGDLGFFGILSLSYNPRSSIFFRGIPTFVGAGRGTGQVGFCQNSGFIDFSNRRGQPCWMDRVVRNFHRIFDRAPGPEAGAGGSGSSSRSTPTSRDGPARGWSGPTCRRFEGAVPDSSRRGQWFGAAIPGGAGHQGNRKGGRPRGVLTGTSPPRSNLRPLHRRC